MTDLAARLASFIAEQEPDAADVAINELARVRGGASSEIWAFMAGWTRQGARAERRLVLRRASENEFASLGRVAEFRLLRALEATPIPTPKAFWLDPDGRSFTRPSMVMEHLPGTADRGLLTEFNRLDLDLRARLQLAHDMADLLADIHALDSTVLERAGLDQRETEVAPRQIDLYVAEMARRLPEPMPEMDLAVWWLRDNMPAPPDRPCLVHGDFRPANLLVSEGRISAILDWEFAHAGDPDEDLGWHLAPHYADEHLVPGSWTAEDFLIRYEARAGRVVDRTAVRFWAIFALYKMSSMVLSALTWFVGGDDSRMIASAKPIVGQLLSAVAAADRDALETPT